MLGRIAMRPPSRQLLNLPEVGVELVVEGRGRLGFLQEALRGGLVAGQVRWQQF